MNSTINQSDIISELNYVCNALKLAEEHHLSGEVVTFALQAMKDNSSLSIMDAICLGFDEWIK
jgi:hypothetical protein